ncbi:elongation factor P [Planctomycetota bacterium]|nr:elongation factor P [Planctomycetota bacterium]
MGSIEISEVSKGTKLLIDNAPWNVIEANFFKPGKGNAVYTLRVMNLITRNTLEKTYRGGEKMETADITDVEMQFLYSDTNGFVFMDTSSFEQITVTPEAVGDDKDFLLENMPVGVTLWNNQPIALRLPTTITVEVVYTEPAVKGDTQSRVMKPAKINTGAEVKVPIFIAIGERIIINTQSREYSGRAQK